MSRSSRPHRPPPTPPKLSRSTGTVDLKNLLVVCCEGLTEKAYIEAFRAQNKAASVVDVHVVAPCGVPSSVVEAAIAHRSARNTDLRRGGRVSGVNVQAWAVVDRDEFPAAILGRAHDLARSNNVPFVLSNPCFELWPLLHLVDQRAWIHRHDRQRRLHQVMPSYHHDNNPYMDMATLTGHEAEAERRAQQLERQHAETGADDPNPSTGLWRLCRAIRGE